MGYKETDTILYAVDFNYSKDQHLRGAYEAFGTFLKKKEKAPTLVITDAYKESLLSYNIRIQTMLHYIEYYRLYLLNTSKNMIKLMIKKNANDEGKSIKHRMKGKKERKHEGGE